MTDKQFEHIQAVEREARALLKSKLVETKQVVPQTQKGISR
jgi:hypothetical protein